MNKRIVFIGHSIINGYPLSRNQCFVGLLKSETSIDIINQGANGETTSDIMRRFTIRNSRFKQHIPPVRPVH